jgi:microcystin-dependent protein
MADAFIGEIKLVSFNFPPRNWAACNGQYMSIPQNQALFSLLGTYYGGDGVRTFQLPNFQGREPLHRGNGAGQSYVLGQVGGEATHPLTVAEIPSHTHSPVQGSSAAPTVAPFTNNLWSAATAAHYTKPDDPAKQENTKVAMSRAAIGNTGSNQGHENMPPYLVLNFVICLMGIYPSRS